MEPAAPSRSLAVAACVFLVALLPLLSVPVLPVIDFYNHAARYYILSRVEQTPFLAQNYQPAWALLPNIGMDVIGTWAMSVLPPELVPQGLAALSMAVQFSGVLFFSRRLIGRWSVVTPLLAAPLLYSYVFVWGFANFLLGLGLVFWAAGLWLALRRKLIIAAPLGCLFALLILLCHGVAFALYGLLVGGLELGFFLAERRPLAAARQFAALAIQAVMPVAMFLSMKAGQVASGVTNADESVKRLAETGHVAQRLAEIGLYRLQTIVRVAEGPTLWFDGAAFGLTVGILLILAWRGRLRIAAVAWPALAIGALLVVAVPPAMFGVGYVADRMPLFLAYLVVGSLDVRFAREALDRLAVAALLALLLVRLAYTGLDWRKYRADFREFVAIASHIPPGSLVAQVNVDRNVHVSPSTRCEMYGPLLVMQGQATPLFANPAQQPMRIVGPLREAGRGFPAQTGVPDADAPAFFSHYIDLAAQSARYDYLLICGAERLTRRFPAHTAVVAKTRRFTLLRLGVP